MNNLIEVARLVGMDYDFYEEIETNNSERPVKNALMEKVRNNQYDTIIVYKLCYWAKSSSELLLDFKLIFRLGMSFISIYDDIDYGSNGELNFQILFAYARFLRSLKSPTIKESHKKAITEGKRIGRPIGSKDSKKRIIKTKQKPKPKPKQGFQPPKDRAVEAIMKLEI